MRKRTGESQRGKSEAAQAALAEIHARAKARRKALVDRIIAEIERRQEALTFAECAEVAGVSLNTVKAAVRESRRVRAIRPPGESRTFISIRFDSV